MFSTFGLTDVIKTLLDYMALILKTFYPHHEFSMFLDVHTPCNALISVFLPASPKAKAGRGAQSLRPSVPKSCHRNCSETTDPIIM